MIKYRENTVVLFSKNEQLVFMSSANMLIYR